MDLRCTFFPTRVAEFPPACTQVLGTERGMNPDMAPLPPHLLSYSGMSPEMVDRLAAEYSIYMTRNGRISMAGVNTKNVDALAAAIHAVTNGQKQ